MPFTLPTETYITGQGGHVIIGGVANSPAFPVAEWRGQKYAKLADSTTSASGGEQRTTVLRGGSFTFNVPWNSTLNQQPEALGFREGGSVAAVGFILGGGLMWYTFPAIMEKIEIICNATNDIVRLTISGYCQGAWPDPVAQPA